MLSILFSLFILISAFAGFNYGINGAVNVSVFVSWVVFFASFSVLTDKAEEMALKEKSKNSLILKSVGYAGLLSLFVSAWIFIWFSYIMTGFALLFSVFLQYGFALTMKKKAKSLKGSKEDDFDKQGHQPIIDPDKERKADKIKEKLLISHPPKSE